MSRVSLPEPREPSRFADFTDDAARRRRHLYAAVAAEVVTHSDDDSGLCTACGDLYPCATRWIADRAKIMQRANGTIVD